jgi:hypothetical protein
MNRDFESAKYGYSIELYLEVLEVEVALIFIGLGPGYKFI